MMVGDKGISGWLEIHDKYEKMGMKIWASLGKLKIPGVLANAAKCCLSIPQTAQADWYYLEQTPGLPQGLKDPHTTSYPAALTESYNYGYSAWVCMCVGGSYSSSPS